MKNNLAECVEIDIVEDRSRIAIVNGVEQVSKIALAKCPNCDSVLCNFGSIVGIADLLRFCSEHQKRLLDTIRYCCKCGQEIYYPSIVEVEEEK